MRRLFVILILILSIPFTASAQGILGDVLSGQLVRPKLGQWSWYDLTDTKSGKQYALRQAIVGEEKVGRKKGYWLETEIVPRVGYSSIYKMLVTGPTSDPKNIHRMLIKEGKGGVVEYPVDTFQLDQSPQKKPKKTSLGKEEIHTPEGTIRAEHIVIEDSEGGIEMWLNDDVRPLGIVLMRAPGGELRLRNYGVGGEEALSKLIRIMQAPQPEEPSKPKLKAEGAKIIKEHVPLDAIEEIVEDAAGDRSITQPETEED